jgi:hypothetical protein
VSEPDAPPPPPPDAPPPPPTPDAPPPVCALGGQDCSDSVPCCDGFVCDVFGGGMRCPPGGTGCTCYRLIM